MRRPGTNSGQIYPAMVEDPYLVRPTRPHSGDDEFNTDTLDSAWATVNSQGTVSVAQKNGVIATWGTGIASNNLVAEIKPITISSGGYIEAAVRLAGGSTNGSTPTTAGIVLTDGTTAGSNQVYLGVFPNGIFFCGGTLNSVNGSPGGLSSLHTFAGPTDRVYLRLIWQASNTWRMNVSLGGGNWQTLGIADVSKTMTPTQMGFAFSDWGTSSGVLAAFDYIRCNG